jgi:mRNA interferase MazF
MKQRIGGNLLATRSGSDIYIPDQGDIVWLNFDPQAGHEQNKRRPAIVISPMIYNNLTLHLALVCPITSVIKRYPFEVLLPKGMKTKGAALADQIKSFDWKAREVAFIEKAPISVVVEITAKLKTLFPKPEALSKE